MARERDLGDDDCRENMGTGTVSHLPGTVSQRLLTYEARGAESLVLIINPVRDPMAGPLAVDLKADVEFATGRATHRFMCDCGFGITLGLNCQRLYVNLRSTWAIGAGAPVSFQVDGFVRPGVAARSVLTYTQQVLALGAGLASAQITVPPYAKELVVSGSPRISGLVVVSTFTGIPAGAAQNLFTATDRIILGSRDGRIGFQNNDIVVRDITATYLLAL